MSKSSYALLLLIYLSACNASTETAQTQSEKVTSTKDTLYNQLGIDSAKNILQDGDLVFRKGADVISDLFSNCNAQDKSFSHCGIFLMQNDTGYVYHSIGGTYNPSSNLRRDNISAFLNADSNSSFGIYRINKITAQLKSLHQVIDSFYALPIKFDVAFNLQTDSLQYCAEFVYKSVHLAYQDSLFSTTKIAEKNLVCIDNIFLSKHCRPIMKFSFRR
jgi:hypothetical protein